MMDKSSFNISSKRWFLSLSLFMDWRVESFNLVDFSLLRSLFDLLILVMVARSIADIILSSIFQKSAFWVGLFRDSSLLDAKIL